MRYEDASQTGTTGSDVNARDDADHLAANDFGPATGNIITGVGTITGATGTDSSGHIVAIQGAGGSDDMADGKLEVAGQYGTLTIDADGNYSYVRNAGSPEGVSDTFTYTLANDAGATDTAKLTINIGDLPMLQAQGTQTIQTANGAVVLPAGVELSDIRVVGRDLVVTLPDGSTMVIPDGAIFVPELVVNGVEVPASNLAALLIDSEPKPAAGDLGPSQLSSGGNFGLPPGPLDPGVPLGDLIPPTELHYTPPEFHEPGIEPEGNEPPIIGTSAINVSEESVTAIAPPIPDTTGSPDTTNERIVQGTIPVSDPDGDVLTLTLGAPPSGLTSQGTLIVWTVSADGQTVTGTAGPAGPVVLTLHIDTVTATGANYTVTLSRPVDHPNAGGEQGTGIVVPVSVSDGDAPIVTGGSITVTIEDDSPTIVGQIAQPDLVVDDTTLAVNDTDTFAGSVTVSFGADGPAAANSLAYALGTPGGASGIIDVATGEAVNLSLVSGVVQGRTATTNQLVFTVSVDGSGNVTLDQLRAVQHNDPTDPVESGSSAATLSADNLVTLNIVATDRDGDQASISVNIGQNLHFEDDGPSISRADVGEPQLTVDDTTLGTNASGAFAGLFVPVFGNDGPAAGGGIAYGLSVVAGASGIVDVATGEAVNLVMNGAVVEGRSATTNQLVFTVSVDANGVVTLDQIRAVQHNDPTDPIESGVSAAGLTLDTLVKLTATVTDKDGDQASAAVNIGSNLHFEDDGPSVSVTSATEPQLIVDDTTLGTNASGAFAGLFAPVFGNDGPASGGGIAYGLSIVAGASGIVDVATGEIVNLAMNGAVVEGRTAIGNLLVFTVTVDGSGVVTLDQVRAVQHNDPSDPIESGGSAATLTLDTLVKLTATVSDKDGDSASASVDIGANLHFEDDGPSISVTSVSEPQLIVDDTTLGTNSSASFAGLFAPVFGNDGPATGGGIAYGLGIAAGASGIVDVATGEAVNLVMNGAVVEGRSATTNQLVFTVTVDANGVVTLDQSRAVQHNDASDPVETGGSAATLTLDTLVNLTATVTDKDGDTATATVSIGNNLHFEDDGPSAGVNSSATEPVLVVDDTTLLTNASASFAGLFSTGFGNDGAGPGGGLAYGLSITAGASGIVDVATGEAVNLVMNGAVVEGRSAVTNQLVFTISVNGSGVVALDQIRAVQHNDPTDPDEPGASAATLSADNLVKLTVTVTDGDSDTATATIDIGQNFQFKDDAPNASSSGTEPQLIVDDTTLGADASASFAGLFSGSFGNDGPAPGGGITYGLSITAGASGIIDVATGQAVNLVMNGNVVEGRTAGSNALVFTVSVDSAGVVTLDQIRAVQHNDPTDPDEPGLSAATLSADNLIKLTAVLTDKDGDTATVSFDIGQNLQFKDDGPSAGVTTATEPTIVVDDTTLTTNASGAFAGLFTTGFGNDGAGPGTGLAYGLSITAGASGIVDVATGEAVNLVMNGAVVEGRSATTNQLVFTVTVDANGVVTLDQIRAVQHNDPTDPDEPGLSAATLSADNLIKLTVTVTDKDLDTATATINIGQNLQFKDDGPSVSITTATEPQLTVDDTTLGTNASGAFAGLFAPIFGNDGPNGAGTTYGLSIVAGPSGIVDVATGEAVNLVMNGAVVEGRSAVTNQLVFTISVNGSGVVTLDQIRAVQHNDPTDPIETGGSAAALTADNLVKLTATVTDKDGDSASATVNIGSNLHFEDDGPSISVTSVTEPQLTVDDTTLGTNASGAFAGLFAPVFGNDGSNGAGTTYGLSVVAGASGIVDVATGEAVNLVMNGAVVEGRSATTNQLVFTVTVDSAGVVTLDQIRAVQHNDPSDPIETGGSAASLTLDTLVKLTATVTDKDGDSATATVNIGSNLHFEDDGPSVSITIVTEPQLTVDDTTLGTNASGAFAGLFAPVFGNDGAATGGGIAYGLSIVAGASGIVDVATGEAVNLVMNGAVVEGRSATTNQLVFTVSVSNTGVVTLDQIRAVQHNDPSDPIETGGSAAGLTLDTLVKLTATVTDKDGDSATATVNIGSNLHFEDDGPSVSVTAATEPQLVVDDTTLGTNAIASFAGLFAPVFGNDGAAVGGGLTYGLSVVAGASGIVDVATGEAVNLVMNGAVVEGRSAVTNQLVFTVTVDSAGAVTLDQIRAVQHNDPTDPDEPGASAATLSADNLVKLTATVTDKDGDTATATVNIGSNLQFKDDGPSVSASGTQPILVVDDTTLATDASASFAGLFVKNFGADGAAASNSTTYALSATAGASGIVDVATGQAVNLVLNGTTVEGRTAVSNQLVFTVTVDSNGLVTLNQIRAVQHNNPADPDEPGASAATLSADNLIKLTATVVDKDGDTATASIDIGQNLQFKDDGPTLGTIQNGTASNDPTDPVTTGSLNFLAGADGAGTNMTITANVTGLTSGGVALETSQTAANVLTAYTDTDNDNTVDAGEAVFTLTVNTSGGPNNGTYAFNLIKPLDGSIVDTPVGGTTSFGAGPQPYQVVSQTNVSTDPLAVITGWQTSASFNAANWFNGTNQLPAGLTIANVNGSTAGWGVDNNNFTSGEFLRFDFGEPIDDFDGAGGYAPPNPAVNLPQISTATFQLIGYGSGETFQFVLHLVDALGNPVGSTNATFAGDAGIVTVSAPAGSFIDWVDLYTPNAGSGKVDLVSVGVSTTNTDFDIPFTLQLTDGDGDTTTTGNFTINVADGNAASAASPVALDTNDDGVVSFLDHSAGVAYDYNGDGDSEATAWVAPGDSILVRDANQNGAVDNASEFVFGQDGQTDMQALAAQYGATLDANDADFGKFMVWNDANSNGAADAGELTSLADAGITSIGLVSDGISYTAANGDVLVAGSGTYTNADGTTGVTADAAFATDGAAKTIQEVERIAANSNGVTLAAAVAAAGVAASSAAAAAPSFDSGDHQAVAHTAVVAMETLTDDGGQEAARFSSLTALQDSGFDLGTQTMASTSHLAIGASQAGELASALSIGTAPATLLDATDLGNVLQMPATSNGMSVAAMPTAESFNVANLGAGGQANGTVEQIVADALHGGGNGPDINALLSALPGGGLGADAGLPSLASPVAEAVSNGDMGQGGIFTFDAATIITTEAMVLHHDAVQPVANG